MKTVYQWICAKINHSTRAIILIWLAWVVILISFQALVQARFQPMRPDYILPWTRFQTDYDSNKDHPYLTVPFMNNQVAFDSEFYLSIALHGGYDDPIVGFGPRDRLHGVSVNYTFMPLYPFAMRLVGRFFQWLGMSALPSCILAGVLISILGTLFAMLALYDLAHGELGEEGGLRAAFYFIIFPTGFFLAQVYTEGMFAGLAFSSLALARRKHWAGAAALAALATGTRSIGGLLFIPLALIFLQKNEWKRWAARRETLAAHFWHVLGAALLILAPLAAYLIWRFSYLGERFFLVESDLMTREPFALAKAFSSWARGFWSMFGNNPQAAVYYAIEFASIFLAWLACGFASFRRDPALALFGLAVIVVPLTSGYGAAQGMARYVMAAPTLFLMLSRWGRNPVFDRVWTLISLLLMGLLATLFTFDLWVA